MHETSRSSNSTM